MKEILLKIIDSLNQDESTILVTITSSSGSAPRKVGSKMLIGKDGLLLGTIGGGAVEFESQKQAMSCLKDEKTMEKEFYLSPNEAADIGMICGGKVKIFFQYISKKQADIIEILEKTVDILAKNQSFYFLSNMKTGELNIYSNEKWLGKELSAEVPNSLIKQSGTLNINNDSYYCEFFEVKGHVLVFGGGHVAQALIPVLNYVGFNTIVLDDRVDFLTEELFPLADKRLLVDLNNISASINVGNKDYAVIMTRGHMFDLALEKQLLKTPAHYIGVMGSRHKIATHVKELKNAGFSEEDIKRLVMPIGLDIGGETPEELAISVVSQLIQFRSREVNV